MFFVMNLTLKKVCCLWMVTYIIIIIIIIDTEQQECTEFLYSVIVINFDFVVRVWSNINVFNCNENILLVTYSDLRPTSVSKSTCLACILCELETPGLEF